ncbi:hypothetical protein Bequi_02950 [Brachybacterium sp. JHP9]|uniref:Type II toxin-antitoxin system RelE/ParE family toxin n=1 Tax=Brachybacterium equifaecis TaxID=2910770 RepID=A0ABT0QXW7_9MICO|nr:hypothetical protein [Brachybacterium equifaecis]MCL6422349.1 hypothetical protein [Brachybacterium equifaecis]
MASRRTLIFSDAADRALTELEKVGDQNLLDKLDDAFDAIEVGAARAKRGPYELAVDGGTVRGWMIYIVHGPRQWVIAWTAVDADRAKIHHVVEARTTAFG